MKFVCTIICFLILSCSNPYGVIDRQRLDCSKSTQPSTISASLNEISVVIEVYNSFSEIVYIRESVIDLPYAPQDLEHLQLITWNGLYKNGEKADPGTYVVKVSIHMQGGSQCHCGNIFIPEQ